MPPIARAPRRWTPAARNVVRCDGLNGSPSSTSDIRLQHLAAHLHGLGPRATYELLREIAAGADIFERLERYARLDPRVLNALGADRMPPRLDLVPVRTRGLR
jgi:hypothetical protein